MGQQLITVFTPTYNRKDTLKRLYNSLVNQTFHDFCWLIVDDGSTDETEECVQSWILEDKIEIRYFKQENRGKTVAHNVGVSLTETELFMCVDSDDYLTEDALSSISECWKTSKKSDIGIIAVKTSEDRVITKVTKGKTGDRTTQRKSFVNLGLQGDAVLLYRTKIMQKYRFPEFEGEKFVPEDFLYDLLDQDGNLIFLNKAIYICEYLNDGYTSNMARLLKNNPCGYLAFINQRLRFDTSIKEKFLDSIRYVAMAKAKNVPILKNSVYPLYAFLAYPAGLLFYYRRYKNI